MTTLLIVHHSPTPLLQEVFDAVRAGASDPLISGVDVVVREALEATEDDLLAADAIVLGTSANFGYISGALKHFFDTTFMLCHEEKEGLPFSYWIRGGMDTTGAQKAMETITTGYGWEKAAEPVCFTGELTDERKEALYELGATVAATIAEG